MTSWTHYLGDFGGSPKIKMVGSLPGMRGTNSSILKAWVALVSKRQKIKVASSTWKAIEATKNLIKKGAFFLLRDGKSTNIWTDPWVP